MKKRIIGAVVVLIVLIDLFALLYPTLSNYFNSKSQSRVVALYLDDVAVMDSSETQPLLLAAHEYNKNLIHMMDRFSFSEEEMQEYNKLLNIGRGVMGVLVIDKINVKLPIYHGTDEGVLQAGLGHLPGSSLPVGGPGTHAVITGHRGLPSSTLLTSLDKMAEGDIFTLYVMREELTYQADKIQTVEPHEIESLNIEADMDYCTLVTCTPYGVNSHRLLVRGHRVESIAAIRWDTISADARQLKIIMAILILLIPILPVLLVYTIIKHRQIQKRGIVQQ
jgi:sortase A